MIKRNLQCAMEEQLLPSTVRKEVKAYLESIDSFNVELMKCHGLVSKWLNHSFNEEKSKRLNRLKGLDEEDRELLINKIIYKVILSPTSKSLFSAVVPSIYKMFTFLDSTQDKLQTACELLSVLSKASKIFSITKAGAKSSLVVECHLKLPKELQEKVSHSYYMIPIFSRPSIVSNNSDTAYVSIKKSVICGQTFNHHEDDVCLDVMNIMNKNRLCIDFDFIQDVEEPFSLDEDDLPKNFKYLTASEKQAVIDMKKHNFQQFSQHTKFTLKLIKEYGNNDFSLNHKIDKRGRIYADGYVINSQGDSYRKAMLDFKQYEEIEIPQEFKI